MSESTTTRLQASSCPRCAKRLDAATSIGEKAGPAPGDLTVCIECGQLLVFNDDMSVREMAPEYLRELPTHLRVRLLWLQALIETRERIERERKY